MEIDGRLAYAMPDKNVVTFFWEPVKNNFETEKQKCPVFDKVLYAEIRSPGIKTQIQKVAVRHCFANGKVREPMSGHRTEDQPEMKWVDVLHAQLEAFEKNSATPDNGTPLETWPKLDVAQIAGLRASGVHTLEQLAAVPDSTISILGMGGMTMKQQAAAFLESVKGNDVTDQIIAENQTLKERLAALEEQFASLKPSEEQVAEQKRGPGRPRLNPAA